MEDWESLPPKCFIVDPQPSILVSRPFRISIFCADWAAVVSQAKKSRLVD